MVNQIRDLAGKLPSDEDFGNLLRRLALGATTFANPTALGRSVQPARQEFQDLVVSGTELVRGQAGLAFGAKVEPISHVGGQLAVEAGLAANLDDGIVLFHERISTDKPAFRRVLRRFDERAGRLKPRKVTKPMKIVRLALQAGMVRRGKDGKIKGLTPAAQRLVKRAQSRGKAATRKATIARQKRLSARLRGL